MAATNQPLGFYTYRDLAREFGHNAEGDRAVVQLAAEQMPMLDDMPVRKADTGRTCETDLITELPIAEFVGIYDGVQPSRSSRQVIRCTCGTCASTMEIASRLMENPKVKSRRIIEETRNHMQALQYKIGRALIYGDTRVNALAFNGFNRRFNKYSPSDLYNDKVPAFTVLNGAKASSPTTTDLRSIYLVGWSPDNTFCFYPDDSPSGGIHSTPMNTKRAKNPNTGGEYDEMYKDFFWDIGLCIRDYRQSGRVCNLSLADMFTAATTAGDAGRALCESYTQKVDMLIHRVKSQNTRRVIYMDSNTNERLHMIYGHITALNAWQTEQLQNRPTETLFGVPVRTNDAQNVNEDAVEAYAE